MRTLSFRLQGRRFLARRSDTVLAVARPACEVGDGDDANDLEGAEENERNPNERSRYPPRFALKILNR
jgi:hypothetical protein